MRSFYTLALLLGCLLLPINATYKMHPTLAKCLADHSVSEDDLNAAANKPTIDVDIPVKCAVKCILMEVGIVNDLGQLQTGELIDIFNYPIIRDYLMTPLSACQDIEDSSACETAFLTLLCLRKYTWLD